MHNPGAGIDVLLSSLAEPERGNEIRFPISGSDFGAYGEKVLTDLKKWALAPGAGFRRDFGR